MHINWLILAVVVLLFLALLSFVMIYNLRGRRNMDSRWPGESTTEEGIYEDFKRT